MLDFFFLCFCDFFAPVSHLTDTIELEGASVQLLFEIVNKKHLEPKQTKYIFKEIAETYRNKLEKIRVPNGV